jgi:hypothetical protein
MAKGRAIAQSGQHDHRLRSGDSPQFINADKVFGTQDKLLRFLRQEEGVDVYLNLLTGKGGYMGRT